MARTGLGGDSADARLVTIQDGGHAPWIEAPDRVFQSIDAFLGGERPAAVKVESV
jgi:pimeloyl-ACP methyl ester carboxylesterase